MAPPDALELYRLQRQMQLLGIQLTMEELSEAAEDPEISKMEDGYHAAILSPASDHHAYAVG
jgi:hypothetical protein